MERVHHNPINTLSDLNARANQNKNNADARFLGTKDKDGNIQVFLSTRSPGIFDRITGKWAQQKKDGRLGVEQILGRSYVETQLSVPNNRRLREGIAKTYLTVFENIQKQNPKHGMRAAEVLVYTESAKNAQTTTKPFIELLAEIDLANANRASQGDERFTKPTLNYGGADLSEAGTSSEEVSSADRGSTGSNEISEDSSWSDWQRQADELQAEPKKGSGDVDSIKAASAELDKYLEELYVSTNESKPTNGPEKQSFVDARSRPDVDFTKEDKLLDELDRAHDAHADLVKVGELFDELDDPTYESQPGNGETSPGVSSKPQPSTGPTIERRLVSDSEDDSDLASIPSGHASDGELKTSQLVEKPSPYLGRANAEEVTNLSDFKRLVNVASDLNAKIWGTEDGKLYVSAKKPSGREDIVFKRADQRRYAELAITKIFEDPANNTNRKKDDYDYDAFFGLLAALSEDAPEAEIVSLKNTIASLKPADVNKQANVDKQADVRKWTHRLKAIFKPLTTVVTGAAKQKKEIAAMKLIFEQTFDPANARPPFA